MAWIGIGNSFFRRGGGVVAPNGTPSNLVLTVVSDTEIDGTFTEGSTNQDGFRVYISTDNVTFTEKTTVLSGSFQATGLTAGTLYYFKVVAYKGSTESTATDTESATTWTAGEAIIRAGNTVGWYIAGDGSSTYVTKDGSDFVSVWKDLSGANHPLYQATGTNQPQWTSSGVVFDGVDNIMLSDEFTFKLPFTYYIVLQQISWTNDDIIIEGKTAGSGMLRQLLGTSPPERYNIHNSLSLSGSAATDIDNNVTHIFRCIYNEASSKIQIDNEATPSTGNTGSGNPGGLNMGGRVATTRFANVRIKEFIARNTADSGVAYDEIYNYLKNKYSL